MTEQSKLRIIGGPNGSGKSYFINEVKNKNYFHLSNYVNADDIETSLKNIGQFDFNNFNFYTNQEEFIQHIDASTFKTEIKIEVKRTIRITNNNLVLNEKINSYHSALIADFIRTKLLETNQSFVFETVMSNISKVNFLKLAKQKGYKIYFYFLCTEDVELNKLQVLNRVKIGGHSVPPEKIQSRYPASLHNLQATIELSDVCFCINNKGAIGGFEKIAEIVNGSLINYICEKIPTWFKKYYIDKINN